MDYAKSFTFVFDDPRWKEKIAWGAGLVILSSWLSIILIGILGLLILAGYSIRLLQNVRDGEEFPLPEWDDWGGDFMRGLKIAAVAIIWALPLIIFTFPIFFGAWLSGSGGGAEFFGVSLLLCASCLMIIYGLFVALASPGFYISFASDENISSGLKLTDIWHWTQANLSSVLVAVLIVIVANMVFGFVASIAGLIMCFVGIFATAPLATLATSLYQGHVYGQLAYEFPFGGMGGPGTLPLVESTDLAASPDTAIIDAPVDETTKPEDSPTDATVDDQSGDENKPA